MTDADPARLLAELWYEAVPDLEDPRLLAALLEVSTEAQLQEGSITVPHPEFTMELEEGVVPLLTAVLAGSRLGVDGKSLPDASQTWDWAEAEAALAPCTGSVLVTELLASLFPPQQRVSGLMSVLAVLVEQTHPQAIFWPQSQRATDPANFEPEALDGIINVRFFSSGTDDATMVMDTLALDLFELPDVQCHYREFNPADVATMLYDTAVYLFTQGDVIDDGHTVSGPRGDEHFVCRHENALIGPTRTVIDIDLGEPYAAGERIR